MDVQALVTWLAVIVGAAAALSPVVGFVVAVIKTAAGTLLPDRYYPMVAVAAGVAVAFGVLYSGPGLYALNQAPIIGALAGGIACGLFDYGKSKEPPPTVSK